MADARAQRSCRACGAPLFFAKGPNGKLIPLDMKAPVYRLSPLTETCERATDCHVSHFCTCPKASQFSKGGQ